MDYIEVGKIVNTHGVRGEVKLNPSVDYVAELTEVDTFYVKTKTEYVKMHAERVRIHKNCAIIKLSGVDTMSEAESYRGKVIYIEKDMDLPEGEYYIEDLIGLSVLDEKEGNIGTLTDVFSTGAHDVYEVTTTTGQKVLIPAVSQFIKEINMANEQILVCLIEGMLE